METASVILQVISFRGFGRRIFRMSPIHHHFELAGWPEFTVIVRFWIIAALCVAVGLGLFYADFIRQGGLGVSGRFEGERAVVIGAGVAGSSAARVLAAEGASVRVSESRPARRAVHGRGARRRRHRDADRRPRAVAPRRGHPRRDRSRGARARTGARVGAGARPPRLERDGARRPARRACPTLRSPARTGRRPRRHDRGDACAPTASMRWRAATSGAPSRKPRARARGARGRVLVVPAAHAGVVPSAGLGAAEPRARPPRRARHPSRPTPRRRPASSSARGPATHTWATATTTPPPRARARPPAPSCGSAPARPSRRGGLRRRRLVSRLTTRTAAARRRRPVRRACGRTPPRPPRHR